MNEIQETFHLNYEVPQGKQQIDIIKLTLRSISAIVQNYNKAGYFRF